MLHSPARRVLLVGGVAAAMLASSGTSAFAAAPTGLTHTEFVAAMAAVRTATAASEASGWRQESTITLAGMSVTGVVSYDPSSGRVSETAAGLFGLEATFAERGTGTWSAVAHDPDSVAAQKLLGKPAATYLLTPSWAGEIASVVSQAASSQVTEEIAGVDTAIKTTQDDGTILYSLAVLDPSVNPPAVGGPPAVAFNLDIHTTAENVVIGQTITASDPTYGTTISATQTDSYGAQQITLPAASDTVTSADVRRALNAIHLPQIVHDTASRVAQAAATLARHAHRPISAGDVVLAAKQVVAGAPVRISVTRIKGGVRLSSVNPFTHRTVSNSVVVELAAVVHA